MKTTLLRILTAVLAIGLTAGHYLLIGYPTQKVDEAVAETLSASVEPLPLSVSCPGAFVQVGGADGTELGLVERLGEALIAYQSSSEDLLLTPELSSAGATTASVAGKEQSTALLSMIQAQAVDQQRAIGIQASFCPQPLSEGWLANGAAVSGFESVLIASNPNAIEALIDFDVHTPAGVVSDRFALAPGEEQLFSMARYANGETQFALFFRTNGPQVVMAMQNRQTRGLTPIGIEIENPIPKPESSQVFVGLRELTGAFDLPELRVFNPGETATEVIVTALDGENVELVRLQVAGKGFVAEKLNLSANHQLITLESEEPVLASIKAQTTDPILDFAWLNPATRFTSLSLPLTSYNQSIVIGNPTAAPLEVTLSVQAAARTSVQTFVVPALGVTSLPASGEKLMIEAKGEFVAALEILDPAGYSVITPSENANLGNELSITIR